MIKKSSLLPALIEASTVALQVKARVENRALRRNTSRKIHANHEREIEAVVAKAVAPLIEEQAASMKNELLAMEGTIKGLKFNPNHDPRSGRFSSGTGGGVSKSLKERSLASKRNNIENNELAKTISSESKITLKGRAAAREYTGESYKTVNNHLREGKDIKGLGEGYVEFSKAAAEKLNKPVVVYRGFNKDPANMIKDVGKGGIVEAKGFVSTSMNLTIASGFSKRENRNVLEIKAKTGVGIRNYSSRPDENELVQNVGTKYKFLGSRTEKIDVYVPYNASVDHRMVNVHMLEEI